MFVVLRNKVRYYIFSQNKTKLLNWASCKPGSSISVEPAYSSSFFFGGVFLGVMCLSCFLGVCKRSIQHKEWASRNNCDSINGNKNGYLRVHFLFTLVVHFHFTVRAGLTSIHQIPSGSQNKRNKCLRGELKGRREKDVRHIAPSQLFLTPTCQYEVTQSSLKSVFKELCIRGIPANRFKIRTRYLSCVCKFYFCNWLPGDTTIGGN